MIFFSPVLLAAPNQPSFDCTKAASPLEKKICGSAPLSRLDLEIAGFYAAALEKATTADKALIKKEQREWNAGRAARCPGLTEACLGKLLGERSAALGKRAGGGFGLAPVSSSKDDSAGKWPEKCFRGPDQILCISKCTGSGCSFEFAGIPNAPCEDKGAFRFSGKGKSAGVYAPKIKGKKCKTQFSLSPDHKTIEVDAGCACNTSLDDAVTFDLGGDYTLME